MITTKITVKEYLLTIFYSIEEIKRKNNYLCKIINKEIPKEVLVSNLDKIGTSYKITKPAENIYKKIISIQEEIIELKNRITEANDLIDTLKKPQYKFILKYRYIYGKSFVEISDLMRINKKYVFFLHREALQEFEKIFQKKINVTVDFTKTI